MKQKYDEENKCKKKTKQKKIVETIWDFLWKSSPHTPYKVQSDKFSFL